MSKQKAGAIVLISLLSLSGGFLLFRYAEQQKEIGRISQENVSLRAKQPYIEFNQLFVDKVLRGEGEIDFETRYELENKVRGLGDEQIKGQWDKFVAAETEAEAQQEVKALLGLLSEKIKG